VLTGAALCPSPPLLYPGLTGREAVLPALREACAGAVGRLLAGNPEAVAVIGPAAETGNWDVTARLDPSAFAPRLPGAPGPDPSPPAPGPDPPPPAAGGTRSPPLSIGLGAMLLDQAGYRGRRKLLAVGQDEPASACVRLGAALGETGTRTGLLVIGDGSARRSTKAPGHLDPRAAAFDAEVERAVRTGDLAALERLDEDLARDLMATGRPAWQALAGAMGSLAPAADILYCDDPFGVAYLVAYLRPDSIISRSALRLSRWARRSARSLREYRSRCASSR
jgi:hypothetical protein